MLRSGADISFSARFSGKPTQISVPISAALAIYARENGEGTVFTADEFLEDEDDFAPDLESVETSDEIIDETPPEKPENPLRAFLSRQTQNCPR